jgi:hypothetical protein
MRPKKEEAMGIMIVYTLAAATFMTGCMAQPKPATPVSYTFAYNIPKAAAQPLPVTIALVRPSFADPAAFAQSPHAREAGSAFVSSMKSDLEKMLVAKGFKVTGPYDSIDVMTFPEKKTADLTLTPVVDVRATEQVTNRSTDIGNPLFPYQAQEGVSVVSGWVSLVMLEPLTSEKIWIKRIEVSPMQEGFVWKYQLVQRGNQVVTHTLEDTRGNSVAAALSKVYPKVMQATWDYFHPDEVLLMKKQAEEARRLKRY